MQSEALLSTTLGAICEQQGGGIQTGPFGSQLHASDYAASGTPVVMPADIVGGRVSTAAIARVAVEHVERLSQHQLRFSDIVFSRRGDVTRFARVAEREVGWLCGTGCLKVRIGTGTIALPEWIAIALGAPEVKDWLVRHAVGATMPNLNTSILGAVPLRVPPIEQQREAVEVCFALDDRIDLLRQTNATLESITQALFPRQPRAQRRFLNALREANPQVDFGEKGEQPLDAGVSLVIPDTRRAPVVRKTTKPKDRSSSPPAQKAAELASVSATGQMSDRLTISGDAVTANEAGSIGDAFDPALRYSSDLSIGFSDKVSENTRAMLRVEYRLLNALVFQAEKQLELAEQLRNLEARFEEMRATNESVANPAVAQTQPPLAAKAPDEEVLADAAQPKEKEAKPATAAPVTEAPAWWPPVLLLLALSGLLAWWLARRSRAGKAAVVAADLSEADLRATSGAFAVRDTLTRTDPLDTVDSKVAAKVLAFQPDIPLDVSKPLPFHDDHEARTAPPASAIEVSHVEEADDSGTVLELAEIMVSFGRVKGACQALAEYLENNPDASLLPWLKLLEIHRMNDMRDEFVDCSTRLRSHFNVAPASWDEAGACLGEKIEPLDESELSIDDILQKLPTVGTFPHVREGIAKTWGTNEGLTYLKHLLRDTRNGQRTGFPLHFSSHSLHRRTRPRSHHFRLAVPPSGLPAGSKTDASFEALVSPEHHALALTGSRLDELAPTLTTEFQDNAVRRFAWLPEDGRLDLHPAAALPAQP